MKLAIEPVVVEAENGLSFSTLLNKAWSRALVEPHEEERKLFNALERKLSEAVGIPKRLCLATLVLVPHIHVSNVQLIERLSTERHKPADPISALLFVARFADHCWNPDLAHIPGEPWHTWFELDGVDWELNVFFYMRGSHTVHFKRCENMKKAYQRMNEYYIIAQM